MNDKIKYEAAKKRVEKLKGFYIHLLVYTVVNIMIIYANFQHSNNNGLFEFKNFSTAFFWGIGLAAHGLSVFSLDFILGKDWEERKIKELMDKERDQYV